MFDSYRWRYHRGEVLAGVAIAIVIGVLGILLSAFVFMSLWNWVIPDVFSGAVRQDILPGSLSYGEAFKLVLFLWLVGMTGKASSYRQS